MKKLRSIVALIILATSMSSFAQDKEYTLPGDLVMVSHTKPVGELLTKIDEYTMACVQGTIAAMQLKPKPDQPSLIQTEIFKEMGLSIDQIDKKRGISVLIFNFTKETEPDGGLFIPVNDINAAMQNVKINPDTEVAVDAGNNTLLICKKVSAEKLLTEYKKLPAAKPVNSVDAVLDVEKILGQNEALVKEGVDELSKKVVTMLQDNPLVPKETVKTLVPLYMKDMHEILNQLKVLNLGVEINAQELKLRGEVIAKSGTRVDKIISSYNDNKESKLFKYLPKDTITANQFTYTPEFVSAMKDIVGRLIKDFAPKEKQEAYTASMNAIWESIGHDTAQAVINDPGSSNDAQFVYLELKDPDKFMKAFKEGVPMVNGIMKQLKEKFQLPYSMKMELKTNAGKVNGADYHSFGMDLQMEGDPGEVAMFNQILGQQNTKYAFTIKDNVMVMVSGADLQTNLKIALDNMVNDNSILKRPELAKIYNDTKEKQFSFGALYLLDFVKLYAVKQLNVMQLAAPAERGQMFTQIQKVIAVIENSKFPMTLSMGSKENAMVFEFTIPSLSVSETALAVQKVFFSFQQQQQQGGEGEAPLF